MSPSGYERYCGNLLQQAGWKVKVIGAQGDMGVDVLAEMRGIRAAIQAKRHGQRVGNSAVQAIAAGRIFYGAHVAVVVAPSGFTRSAVALARANGIYLLHHSQLGNLEKIARIPPVARDVSVKQFA